MAREWGFQAAVTSLGDTHYTPPDIARAMVQVLAYHTGDGATVADFCSGNGALLEAVEERFPAARCLGTDVDASAVHALRGRHPGWWVGRCDFTDAKSVSSSPLVGPRGPAIHSAVLNPPFSCRGARRLSSPVLAGQIRASSALTFLIRALQRLEPGGDVSILVPRGSLTAERDQEGWGFVNEIATVDPIVEFGRDAFPNAHARTVLMHVRLGPRPASCHAVGKASAVPPTRLQLVRGRFPMHALRPEPGVPLVHTTHLREGLLAPTCLSAPRRYSIQGPLLLIPRVGLPSKGKIVVIRSNAEFALSDCVLGVQGSLADLVRLEQTIQEHWATFSLCYVGTCAPYTTIARVCRTLLNLGAPVTLEPRLRGSEGRLCVA